MKTIHLSNDKRRDAAVGMAWGATKPFARYVHPKGKDFTGVKLVKATAATDFSVIEKANRDVAQALIDGDPEIDAENFGRRLPKLNRVYVDRNGSVAYGVTLMEHVYAPDGTEKQVRPFAEKQANLNLEQFPLRWTGKMFPKKEAARRFVFMRGYQIFHVNGLTYDFLYDMAKKLAETDSVMLVGGGEKGTDSIVITDNGSAYRGFLEGRVDGEKYQLILRLTNFEIKEVAHA